MPARFDSLRQCNRACYLLENWSASRYQRDTRDSSIVCMPREWVERMERAANYLWRRVTRAEGSQRAEGARHA